ncbi:MAG: hypothetical protein FWC83_01335, partial [Alphaproteobacteria bacterium]|nr:hypothetical protein [Alphaproteobacteria bacterium]
LLREPARLVRTGNVYTLPFRAGWVYYRVAGRAGGRAISAARAPRMAPTSGRVRDWMFHATRVSGDYLARQAAGAGLGTARALRQGGMLYGAVRFLRGMYGFTEHEVGDFTSGIQFKPLLLLSADRLEEGNVVNHSMWVLFRGHSTSPADDDAAMLQAFDFAAKFHQDMQETQWDWQDSPGLRIGGGFCDVDIFVVRPIIRNPNSTSPELYYLIMNDVPWEIRSN